MSSLSRRSRAFTLIELLVVIAVIAVLSVVVVLTLQPAELLRQSRDSNRVSDMSSLNTALGLFLSQGGSSLGSVNTIYVSIPDPTATSTAGDQCQGLGLISLPAIYSYHCAASSTYRSVDGTGWIPVNFSSIPTGSPLSQLPIDPINTSSSRNYYTYTTNASQYEVTSVMESSKYKLGGSNDVIGGDGGTLASVYEKGSKLGLEPMDYGDNSLVGFWSFEEGSSSVAYDYSGNNATGSWSGAATGTNGYYTAPGKIGSYAGAFDGSTDYIDVGSSSMLQPIAAGTFAAWTKIASVSNYGTVMSYENVGIDRNGVGMYIDNAHRLSFEIANGSSYNQAPTYTFATSTWYFVVGTWDGASVKLYINGASFSSVAQTITPIALYRTYIGLDGLKTMADHFPGLIDDVRIYNRALSASEIAAMYSGGK